MPADRIASASCNSGGSMCFFVGSVNAPPKIFVTSDIFFILSCASIARHQRELSA